MNAVHVTVRVFGDEATFDMAEDGTTVLAAARDAGIDLPSSCEAGVCATCRAKLLVGEVQFINDFGLDLTDRAENYILACQAVPCTREIVLDFER